MNIHFYALAAIIYTVNSALVTKSQNRITLYITVTVTLPTTESVFHDGNLTSIV